MSYMSLEAGPSFAARNAPSRPAPVASTSPEEWLELVAQPRRTNSGDSDITSSPLNYYFRESSLFDDELGRLSTVVVPDLYEDRLSIMSEASTAVSRSQHLASLKPLALARQLTKRVRNVQYGVPTTVGMAAARVLPTRAFRSRSLRTIVTKFFRKSHKCVICQCPIEGKQIRVACGHYFDVQCLLELVEAATRDESLFPPRCCNKRIADRSFQRLMPQSLAETLAEKSIEFNTTRRVYCASPVCSRFLGGCTKGRFAKIIHCPSPSCSTRTCTRCRCSVRTHATHKCIDDPTQREVLALANEKGWARCPACDQMIELSSGCHHMTCVCSMQFCYVCRAPWKTCSCSGWERVEIMDLNVRPPTPLLAAPARARTSLLREVPSDPTEVHDAIPTAPRARRSYIRRVPVPSICTLDLREATQSIPQSIQIATASQRMDEIDDHIVTRGLLAQRRRQRRTAGRPTTGSV